LTVAAGGNVRKVVSWNHSPSLDRVSPTKRGARALQPGGRRQFERVEADVRVEEKRMAVVICYFSDGGRELGGGVGGCGGTGPGDLCVVCFMGRDPKKGGKGGRGVFAL